MKCKFCTNNTVSEQEILDIQEAHLGGREVEDKWMITENFCKFHFIGILSWQNASVGVDKITSEWVIERIAYFLQRTSKQIEKGLSPEFCDAIIGYDAACMRFAESKILGKRLCHHHKTIANRFPGRSAYWRYTNGNGEHQSLLIRHAKMILAEQEIVTGAVTKAE